jgi:hypothetical protein
MPQLKEFKDAGNDEYPDGNFNGFNMDENESENQAPENFIKKASQ